MTPGWKHWQVVNISVGCEGWKVKARQQGRGEHFSKSENEKA